MDSPKVTIVCVPRERFSFTKESLESIYRDTLLPFKMIYVDGNSPKSVKRYLEEEACEKGFKLLRTDVYLTPNQARNIGLSHVDTPYLVFCDNDVIVSPGWLNSLIECAEETGADVVGPLMCQCYKPDEPFHNEVHFAGGESHIWEDKLGRKRLRERMKFQGKKVKDVKEKLTRTETELAEFHCTLVRTSIFKNKLGQLDEGMLCTKEHLDFCMSVRQAGGKVYFEPNSVVTYVPGPPLRFFDIHYYMLRWSNEWTLKSLEHMREKWNLAEDGYFKSKYKKLGWRRLSTILVPLSHKLTLGISSGKITRFLQILDHRTNRYLVQHNQKRQQSLSVHEFENKIQNKT